MAELQALRELHDFMREFGVEYVRIGDTEMRVGPPVVRVQVATLESTEPGAPAITEEEQELMNLLPGQDITAFMRKADR